jgi:hypothetical protein
VSRYVIFNLARVYKQRACFPFGKQARENIN